MRIGHRALDQDFRGGDLPAIVGRVQGTPGRHDGTVQRKELIGRGPEMLGPLLTAARADVDSYFPGKAALFSAMTCQPTTEVSAAC